MVLLTTNAVILREVPYKENDRILTVLSPEHGLMTIGAKGVRNINSKNSAAVQLFCYSELELVQSGNRFTLRSAHLKEGFFGLRGDILRYALACYASETACYFCTSGSNETEPFRLLLNLFYALVNAPEKPLWLIKAAFELKLCSVCGFMPDFDMCGICGCYRNNESKDAFKTGSKYLFSFTESSPLCKNCAASLQSIDIQNGMSLVPYSFSVSESALYAARFVTQADLTRFLSFKLAEEDAFDFCELCERYLLHQAERGFDTLKYYKSL